MKFTDKILKFAWSVGFCFGSGNKGLQLSFYQSRKQKRHKLMASVSSCNPTGICVWLATQIANKFFQEDFFFLPIFPVNEILILYLLNLSFCEEFLEGISPNRKWRQSVTPYLCLLSINNWFWNVEVQFNNTAVEGGLYFLTFRKPQQLNYKNHDRGN